MPLTAESVGHSFRRHESPVLAELNLTISDGTTTALVGPSGSGKSTLLAILSGLLTPTTGQVLVDFLPLPTSPGEIARLFGWVFQTVNSFGRRTALDNVAAPILAQFGRRHEAEQRSRDLLSLVGMSHRVLSSASSLSGGELQRMCIARALATRPRFLMADEPTGQLDHRISLVVLDALWAARSPETTMLIATHDPIVADRCDRIVHLVDGNAV